MWWFYEADLILNHIDSLVVPHNCQQSPKNIHRVASVVFTFLYLNHPVQASVFNRWYYYAYAWKPQYIVLFIFFLFKLHVVSHRNMYAHEGSFSSFVPSFLAVLNICNIYVLHSCLEMNEFDNKQVCAVVHCNVYIYSRVSLCSTSLFITLCSIGK